ncbi:MAG: TonB-dependent receptor [Gammaproteobacteria bacterium]|nr:TonB-dependent receptor [Gammaproteobacteria bacterium]
MKPLASSPPGAAVSKTRHLPNGFGFFDTFTGNPELEPEHSRAWELGLRHSAGDRLRVSASYFESRLIDEINGFVFDAASGGFTAENVDGKSDRRGVEVDASWQATDTVSLDASYTWLDATEPSMNGELEEVRRPGNTASLRANFDLARVNLNIGAQYNGSQIDTFFPPFPEPSQRVKLDAYTLVDVSLRYQLSDAINLHARVENALDETYEEVFGFRSSGFGAFAGIEVKW